MPYTVNILRYKAQGQDVTSFIVESTEPTKAKGHQFFANTDDPEEMATAKDKAEFVKKCKNDWEHLDNAEGELFLVEAEKKVEVRK